MAQCTMCYVMVYRIYEVYKCFFHSLTPTWILTSVGYFVFRFSSTNITGIACILPLLPPLQLYFPISGFGRKWCMWFFLVARPTVSNHANLKTSALVMKSALNALGRNSDLEHLCSECWPMIITPRPNSFRFYTGLLVIIPPVINCLNICECVK